MNILDGKTKKCMPNLIPLKTGSETKLRLTSAFIQEEKKADCSQKLDSGQYSRGQTNPLFGRSRKSPRHDNKASSDTYRGHQPQMARGRITPRSDLLATPVGEKEGNGIVWGGRETVWGGKEAPWVVEMPSSIATENSEYPCGVCQLTFQDEYSYNKHTQRYHWKGSKPIRRIRYGISSISCDKCGFKASTHEGLKQHMQTKHAEEENFDCSQNSEPGDPQSDLVSQHPSQNIYSSPCYSKKSSNPSKKSSRLLPKPSTTVEKSSNNSSGLFDSYISISCDICCFKASNNEGLKQHMQTKHTGEIELIDCNTTVDPLVLPSSVLIDQSNSLACTAINRSNSLVNTTINQSVNLPNISPRKNRRSIEDTINNLVERRRKVARLSPVEDGAENPSWTDKPSPVSRPDKPSPVSRPDKPSPVSKIVYESPTLTISLTPAIKAVTRVKAKVEDVVCGTGDNTVIIPKGQNSSDTSHVIGSVGDQSQSILRITDPAIGLPVSQPEERSHDWSQWLTYGPTVRDKSVSKGTKQNFISSKKDDIAVSSDEDSNELSINDIPTILSAPTAAEFFLYSPEQGSVDLPSVLRTQAGDLTAEVFPAAPLVPSYACDQCDYVAKSQVAVWHHADVNHSSKQTDKQTNKHLVKQPVCYK